MRSARRSLRRPFEIWPGYVDVLSTLLMVVIFVLMVFVIAQFFLSNALSGRDKALAQLNRQVAELAELLALERSTSSELRLNLAELSNQLQSAVADRDALQRQLITVTGERNALEAAGATAAQDLEDAYKVIEADKAKVEVLLGNLAALESLRDELMKKLDTSEAEHEQAIAAADKRSSSARSRS
jgi:chemotaxis protein MotB